MVKVIRRKPKSFDMQQLGAEPIVENFEDLERSEYIRILNWYNYFWSMDSARKWVKTYLKGRGLTASEINPIMSGLNKTHVPHHNYVKCRLINNGTKVSEKIRSKIVDNFKAVAVVAPVTEVAVEKAPTLSPIQRMVIKANSYIAELEEMLDDVYRGKKRDAGPFFAKQDIKPKLAEIIWNYYQPLLEELNSTDSQVKESYSNVPKKTKKSMVEFIKTIKVAVDHSSMVAQAAKLAKPSKAKKETPAAKQVKGIKYKATDTELKLTSINPLKIIGANVIWLYNSRTRLVTLLRSTATKGFSVSGTTIKGFDPEISSCKTIREPKLVKTLPKISRGASTAKKVKFLNDLSTKAYPASGRLNVDTLILRVL